MMVVFDILAMHHQMLDITCSLRDGCRAKYHCRLQTHGGQESKGDKAK